MPLNFERETPTESAKVAFQEDVEITRYLIYRESEDSEGMRIPDDARQIANDIWNGRYPIPLSPEATVLALYQLDDSKKTRLQLLEGVN